MVWFTTFSTLAPALVFTFLVCWLRPQILDGYPHAEPWLVGVLLFLPFGPALFLLAAKMAWRSPDRTQLIPPWTILLPLAPLGLLVGYEPAESIASSIPMCCEVEARAQTTTKGPDHAWPGGVFEVRFSGSGNPQSYRFSKARICNRGALDFGDMVVLLPGLQSHSELSKKPVVLTPALLHDYVQWSDDLPPEETRALAAELWDILIRYRDYRELPPMTYYDVHDRTSTFAYRVPHLKVCAMTTALSLAGLLAPAAALAFVHTRGAAVAASSRQDA